MKKKGIAGILAIFLGGIGAHKLYLGQHIQFILYVLFSWTFIPAIIGIFEGIGYLSYTNAQFDKRYNEK